MLMMMMMLPLLVNKDEYIKAAMNTVCSTTAWVTHSN